MVGLPVSNNSVKILWFEAPFRVRCQALSATPSISIYSINDTPFAT